MVRISADERLIKISLLMKTADEKRKPCHRDHMALSESKYSVVVAVKLVLA